MRHEYEGVQSQIFVGRNLFVGLIDVLGKKFF